MYFQNLVNNEKPLVYYSCQKFIMHLYNILYLFDCWIFKCKKYILLELSRLLKYKKSYQPKSRHVVPHASKALKHSGSKGFYFFLFFRIANKDGRGINPHTHKPGDISPRWHIPGSMKTKDLSRMVSVRLIWI